MSSNIEELLYGLWQKIIDYLPNLFAGLFLLLVGWLIGWFVKRIVIQLLVILKFDRLFTRIKWKSALSKADVRYALYNFMGNISFFIIFLLFLTSALDAFKLVVFSKLIEYGVLFIPKLLIALVITGIGWLIASRTSAAVLHSLIKEHFPNFSLIARSIKFFIMVFFSAMALIELDIATNIVIIGFTAIVVTISIGTLIILYAGRDSLKNFFTLKKNDLT
ncbi:MAG: hypothetical protein V1720_08750 [bacterium]